MSDSEWSGEPHTLIVHEVRLPDGPLDDGDLGDHDLEHAPPCTKKVCTHEPAPHGGESPAVEEWGCAVARHEAESGLVHEYGACAHGGGVVVMDPEATA